MAGTIFVFIGLKPVLAQEPGIGTSCSGDNGTATCSIFYEGDSTGYIVTSITINVTNAATMHHIYSEDTWPYRLIWAGTATDSVTIDVDDFVLLQPGGAVYRIYYDEIGFHLFSIAYTGEQPVPTATPIPTGTPEPYNEWGRALSETAFVSDFNATMAAANGGTPLDMTPYEIPTASASLPALTLSVADLNTMGKSATTLWALLDQFDVLPFYFLIAIALAVVWWLYRFITDLPTPTPELDFTGAIDVGTGFDDLDIESGLASEEDFRANNKKYGYDDSLARTEALKDRKARNAKRRSLAHGGVSLIRRTRKLF